MNENINLCKILKDCPKGVKLWSPLYGDVEFSDITTDEEYPIKVKNPNYPIYKTFNKNGLFDSGFKGECVLFPSKDQRDWSKWQCPKPKFDPKTLKPFDKVLARINDRRWYADFISIAGGDNVSAICTMSGMGFHKIIPYNDDTKHLVGTYDEAPEYYRYWED